MIERSVRRVTSVFDWAATAAATKRQIVEDARPNRLWNALIASSSASYEFGGFRQKFRQEHTEKLPLARYIELPIYVGSVIPDRSG